MRSLTMSPSGAAVIVENPGATRAAAIAAMGHRLAAAGPRTRQRLLDRVAAPDDREASEPMPANIAIDPIEDADQDGPADDLARALGLPSWQTCWVLLRRTALLSGAAASGFGLVLTGLSLHPSRHHAAPGLVALLETDIAGSPASVANSAAPAEPAPRPAAAAKPAAVAAALPQTAPTATATAPQAGDASDTGSPAIASAPLPAVMQAELAPPPASAPPASRLPVQPVAARARPAAPPPANPPARPARTAPSALPASPAPARAEFAGYAESAKPSPAPSEATTIRLPARNALPEPSTPNAFAALHRGAQRPLVHTAMATNQLSDGRVFGLFEAPRLHLRSETVRPAEARLRSSRHVIAARYELPRWLTEEQDVPRAPAPASRKLTMSPPPHVLVVPAAPPPAPQNAAAAPAKPEPAAPSLPPLRDRPTELDAASGDAEPAGSRAANAPIYRADPAPSGEYADSSEAAPPSYRPEPPPPPSYGSPYPGYVSTPYGYYGPYGYGGSYAPQYAGPPGYPY